MTNGVKRWLPQAYEVWCCNCFRISYGRGKAPKCCPRCGSKAFNWRRLLAWMGSGGGRPVKSLGSFGREAWARRRVFFHGF